YRHLWRRKRHPKTRDEHRHRLDAGGGVEGPDELDNFETLLAHRVKERNRRDARTISKRRERLQRFQEAAFRETLGIFRADAQTPRRNSTGQIVHRRRPRPRRKTRERNCRSGNETCSRGGGLALK